MYDIMMDGEGNIGIYESDSKHIEDIVIQKVGDNKRTPYIGVGAMQFVHGNNESKLSTEITRHCQADGVKNIEVAYNNESKEFMINGQYP